MKRPLFERSLKEVDPVAYDSDFDDHVFTKPKPSKRTSRVKPMHRIQACGVESLDSTVLACKDAKGRVVVVALTEGIEHPDADEVIHATTRDGTFYTRVQEDEPTESEFLGLFFRGRYDATEAGVADLIVSALESAEHVVVVDGSARGLGLARLAVCAAAARAGLAKPPQPASTRYKEAALKLNASTAWWRTCEKMKDAWVDSF